MYRGHTQLVVINGLAAKNPPPNSKTHQLAQKSQAGKEEEEEGFHDHTQLHPSSSFALCDSLARPSTNQQYWSKSKAQRPVRSCYQISLSVNMYNYENHPGIKTLQSLHDTRISVYIVIINHPDIYAMLTHTQSEDRRLSKEWLLWSQKVNPSWSRPFGTSSHLAFPTRLHNFMNR